MLFTLNGKWLKDDLLNNKKTNINLVFYSYPNVNNGRAFIVDIILIYDVVLNKILLELPVNTYFNNDYRVTLKRENFHAIQVITKDIIPGKSYKPLLIPLAQNKILINCIVFCHLNKVDPKTPKKVVLRNIKNATILLQVNGAFLI